MDNRQANINRFEAEMAKVTRDGVDKLMAFIRKSDMYAAPASTRFHLSVTGGLLQHSLNVLDALRANLTKNDDGTYSYEVAGVPAARVTEENVIIMALLHDICKTYFYTTEIRNRKVGGKWEQYEAAVNEMLAKTSSAYAPWNVIEANDKKYARIKVLQTVIAAVKSRLKDDKN